MERILLQSCAESPAIQLTHTGTTDRLATVALTFQVKHRGNRALPKQCLLALEIAENALEPSQCFTVPSVTRPQEEVAVIAPVALVEGMAKVKISVRLDDDNVITGEGEVDFQPRGMASQQSLEAAHSRGPHFAHTGSCVR